MGLPSALGDEPLLTAAEEFALACQIEAGVLAREARLTGRGRCAASDEELVELERLGDRAWQRYIRANLRLVAKTARQAARRSGLAESDLFQEGCLGLICAVERFDCRLGYRFSTYASYWIRATIGAASANLLGALNVSSSRALQARRVRGLEVELTQTHGRSVSLAEVAASAGRSLESTADLLAHQPAQSIDSLDVDTWSWAANPSDEPPDDDRPGRELLWHLEGIEREVLALRFGFTDDRPHTYAEIGVRLGISASRARRLEQRGLEALRSVCPSSARLHLLAG